MYENVMHLSAGKRSLLHQGLFRLAAKELSALPSSEEACFKEGIDWNKVLLQTHTDVLATKIAGLSVKINMQGLPKPYAPATSLGSFFRDQEKIQDLRQDRSLLRRGQPADFVETETMYYYVVWNRYRRY